MTVVLASRGYPASSSQRRRDLRSRARSRTSVYVTHAGTARDAAGELVTAGGRVLGVTGARAPTPLPPARPHMLPRT